MRTIKLTIAATETHCETDNDQCVYMRGVMSSVFNRGLWDSVEEKYKRLPECIAAEKEAGK